MKNETIPVFPRLEGDVKTDVLIIGGGLTGILCAYFLEKAGVDYLLVEAGRICGGTTGHTTAKITVQHGLIYHKLIREFGVEKARMYLEANEAALQQYRLLCREIACDFEQKDSYIYSTGRPDLLERELTALEKLGHPAEFADGLPLPFPTAGAVRFRDQAQFDPMRFISHIAKALRIYEHSPVRSFDGSAYRTDLGSIAAKKVIVATHFPIFNKHGGYFLKLYQHRSYVLALKNAAPEGVRPVNGMYMDVEPDGFSFRNHGELLILGGGAHRTGKQGGGWDVLSAFAAKHYPEAEEAARWAAQDCMTLDSVPYIGQYAKATPDLFVATGFNKWGMTSAMAAAMMLVNLVQEKENPYDPLFSPSRSILRPQLAVNGLEAVINLMTPTVPRCPHLGCALKWNPAEHSWDCPCHGSRFSEEGSVLDGPATGGLKRK